MEPRAGNRANIKNLLSCMLLSLIVIFMSSCSDRNDKILGYWKASFGDSIHNPVQYIVINEVNGNLQLISDEPFEDWYDIPAENISFNDDRLHFERFWGLEKYDGKYSPGESVIKGIKQFPDKAPVQFIMRRISKEKFIHKISRIDRHGNKVEQYQCSKPAAIEDGFLSADFSEAGIDSILIYKLLNKILSGNIPNIHSLLILIDNKLVLEEYFYNYSIDKLHRVHSVSKSFTSALTGIAIDKKFLPGVNEPAWKYFTEWDTTKWIKDKYDIEIRHLLSMSAGLEWKSLTLNEYNDDIDLYQSKDRFEFLLNKNQKFKPGTTFCYNNGLSLMLGHIIEKSSGLSVNNFSKEFLFNDLDINNFSWDIDENGITRTDGGLRLRPRDMLKFGFLYLNKGKWKDKQLISGDWINASTRQNIYSDNKNYGLHWWKKNYFVNHASVESFFAIGHGEQAIIVVPEYDLVVVVTAGNYLQQEHRPFEMMQDYILPSITSVE